MSVPAKLATPASSLGRLKRLRGRSLAEFVARGRQEFAKLGERVRPGLVGEAGDEAFLRSVAPEFRARTAEATAAAVLDRLRAGASPSGGASTFFAAAGRPSEVAEAMRRHYRAERRATIARADRAAAGEFDLLGLERVSFGDPVDWHLEPTTGLRAPLAHWSAIDYLDPRVAGDKKVTWELNRHAHFVAFGQAYAMTGDERYAAAFVEQATAWMDANPPSVGINWASSLELALRSIAWLWALHLVAPARAATPAFVLRALKSLAAHGRHVATYMSHYFSPNTHLTGEALGLLYLGTALPELAASGAWREEGRRVLAEQLERQVRPDGVYFEQSTWYHRYTADFYLHAIALSRAAGAPLGARVEGRARALVDYLAWISEPAGTTPLVGDDDGGRLVDFGWRGPRDSRDTLALAAALLSEPSWRALAGDRAPELLWLLGPEAHAGYLATASAPPLARARAFPDGGYYVMRDGWSPEAGYALVDCGPHGALSCGHAHADALSVVFSADGVSWLVDPGTFTYTGDARLRDAFRTTEAHNTATVDGEPQSAPAGPFSWSTAARAEARAFRAAPGMVFFEGSHDGYERLEDPVTHTRSLLFVEREPGAGAAPYLVLRDAFAARARHDYAIRFHLPANAVAVTRDRAVVAVDPGGASLTIAGVGPGAAPRTNVEQGWVSEAYARRAKAPVASLSIAGEGPQEVASVVVPSSALETTARVHEVRLGPGSAGSALTVDFGAAIDVVLPGDGAEPRECLRLGATAALAWARFVAGRPTRACLVSGSRLVLGGVAALETGHARFAAVAATASGLDVTVEGADEFELEAEREAGSITVDGARFAGCPAGARLAFSHDGPGWICLSTGRRGA